MLCSVLQPNYVLVAASHIVARAHSAVVLISATFINYGVCLSLTGDDTQQTPVFKNFALLMFLFHCLLAGLNPVPAHLLAKDSPFVSINDTWLREKYQSAFGLMTYLNRRVAMVTIVLLHIPRRYFTVVLTSEDICGCLVIRRCSTFYFSLTKSSIHRSIFVCYLCSLLGRIISLKSLEGKPFIVTKCHLT